MNAPDQVMRLLKAEIEWVKEGTDSPDDSPRVHHASVEGWDLDEVERGFQAKPGAPSAAVIDGEFFFDDEIAIAASKDHLIELNPVFLAMRYVGDNGVRNSFVLIRQDHYPTEGQLSSVMAYR